MKEDRFVVILLERGSDVQELRFKWNKLKQKVHAAKELAKHARAGWQLLNVSGNAEAAEQMKRILKDYKPGAPVPVKEMMRESGLQVLPPFLRKKLERESSQV